MPTLIADPATAPAEQPASPAHPGAPPEPPAAAVAPPAPERACANCGSAMNAGQDWCLQCGAGASGSLGSGTPGWRSGASILAATAILALGAAAAAYAALNEHKGRTHTVRTVAQRTPPATPGLVPTVPGAATPTPSSPGTPTTGKPPSPLTTVKPPKIPLTAATPETPGAGATPETPGAGATPETPGAGATPEPTGTGSTPSSTTPSSSTPPPVSGGSTGEPKALLLDTNAASTYNPYAYQATNFGDPSLVLDGETSTGWTAQVDPAVAPKMAEGLAIDLKSKRKLSALALVTATPGLAVQVYGSNVDTLPPSITDPAWVKLSRVQVVKVKHVRIKLRSAKAFRFVTLWISRAPAAVVGTPQAPGHVSINEIELFP